MGRCIAVSFFLLCLAKSWEMHHHAGEVIINTKSSQWQEVWKRYLDVNTLEFLFLTLGDGIRLAYKW